MTERHFGARVLWSDEDEAFVALCPEIPGTSGIGDTPLEAMVELDTALSLALNVMEEERRAIPEPRTLSSFSGQFRVRLPASLHRWLVDEAGREGTSLNTLVVQLLSEARGRAGSATQLEHA
jgi:predicted HicB family RNase H-like nuclease